jgi:hypothetical protein
MSPPAGRKKPDLLHKKIHVVNFFVQKKKRAMLPQANRAIQFNQPSGLQVHRISRVIAILNLLSCRLQAVGSESLRTISQPR